MCQNTCLFSMSTDDMEGPGWRSRHSDFVRAGRSGGSNAGEGKILLTVQTAPGAYTALQWVPRQSRG